MPNLRNLTAVLPEGGGIFDSPYLDGGTLAPQPLRNLAATLSNGRRVFGSNLIGTLGARIRTDTAAAPGEAGNGLLYDVATDANAHYSLHLTNTNLTPCQLTVAENGSASVNAYGFIQYKVFKNNLEV